MEIFKTTGADNTARTLDIALQKAAAMGTDIVAASSRGFTAKLLMEKAKEQGFSGRIIIVRLVSAAAQNGINSFPQELKESLEADGAIFVTAAHALSAGERGISTRFHGAYPLEIMAHTLRTFGAGTKVCFECAVMALDADVIPYAKPVVAVAGTAGHGADTALVITPSYSATILDTKVNELLCKPGFYAQ